MKTPKWTVLYTSVSNDGIRSRNRTFFYNKGLADGYYKELSATDEEIMKDGGDPLFVPTVRPYDSKSDFNCWEH